MTKLIIARHGETDYNIKGLIQGQKQSKLSKNGIAQAKALAKRLKNEKIDLIYTSKLNRSIKTTKTINKFHSLKINKTKKLNEIKRGVWEGEEGEDIRKKFGDKIMEKLDFKPKGAESWKEINKRVVSFIKSLIKKHKNKTILIVAHKAPNRLMINYFLKKPLKNHDKIKQGPACINIVEIENKKAKVKSISDVRHLKGLRIIKEKRFVV